MKTLFISSVLSLLSFCLKAQDDKNITLGKKEVITSKVLNENRTLWIYTPNITSTNLDPNKRYPVLYLLDGEAHFFSTVGIIQQLSQANGNGVLPEMIVVAIENTNRIRDLVPTDNHLEPNPFVRFLSNELIPYIDKNYNTAPYKLLVGHSLGGLTVIDILTNSPNLFNAYLAIDPSMWYNNESYLKNTIAKLPHLNMSGKRLFIGTANTIPKGMTIAQLKKDTSFETQHIRSIFKLHDFMKTNTNGLFYKHKYYETERHNTLPLLCEYDGLRFIFDYYHLDLSEKDFEDSTTLIATKLKTHFAEVSEKMGYRNAPPEMLLSYLGYDAIKKRHFDKAGALFNLNMQWYPESSSVYESYADYFLAINDTANAITNYKKALLINNDTATIGKLNAITKPNKVYLSHDYLQPFTGVYTLLDFNIDIKLEMRNGKLWAIVPGQADSEFLPISENVFTVNGQQGYTITFQTKNNMPEGFTSVQPNGTFKAVFKHKNANTP